MSSETGFDSFDYHAPTDDQRELLERFRLLAKGFRDTVNVKVPRSREASLAVTKIEEALMWANKAVFAPVPVKS